MEHMEKTGMLVGNFEFNPLRRPIWTWLKQILTPKRAKRGLGGLNYWRSARNILSETKIQNLHP